MAPSLEQSIRAIIDRDKQCLTSTQNYKEFALENFPVLQDIDWDIANVLASKWHLEADEVTLILVDEIPDDNIKLCRQQLISFLKSQFAEFHADKTISTKQRQGVTVPSVYARDIIELFLFVNGLTSATPACISVKQVATDGFDEPRAGGTTPTSPTTDTSSESCECSMLRNTVTELIDRCKDYDKAILDMRCQMLELVNKVAELTPSSSSKSNVSVQCDVSQNPENEYRMFESFISQDSSSFIMSNSLQCGQTESCNHVNTFSENISIADIGVDDASLTELLAVSSTPATEKQTSPASMNSSHQSTILDSELSSNHPNSIPPAHYKTVENQIASLHHVMSKFHGQITNQVQHVKKTQTTLKKRVDRIEKDVKKVKKTSRRSCRVNHVTNTGSEPSKDTTVTVPCQNRFDILQSTEDDSEPNHTARSARATTTDTPRDAPAVRHRESRDEDERSRTRSQKPRDATRVTVIGASMTEGMGKLISCSDIDACSFPNPGAKVENIANRLGKLTRVDDEAIVLHIGSNNIPDDNALTLIEKLDGLIDDLRQLRPLAQVVVAPIPMRMDHLSCFNKDINDVNQFLENKCSSDTKLHFLRQRFNRSEYGFDGYHYNLKGKKLFAENAKTAIRQAMIANR